MTGSSFAGAAGWSLIGRLSSLTFLLTTNAVLAHRLSVPEMSQYLVAVSVVTLLANLGQLGVPQIVVKLLGTDATKLDPAFPGRVIRNALLIGLMVGAGLAVGLVATKVGPVLQDWSPSTPWIWPILGAWVALDTLRLIAVAGLRGNNRIREATLLGDAGRNFLILVPAIFLPSSVVSPESMVGASAVCSLALLLILIWTHRVQLSASAPRPEASVRELFGSALPLLLANVSTVAIANFDVWVAGIYFTPEATAFYATASRIAPIVGLPLVILNLALGPVIARAAATGSTTSLRDVLRGTATIATLAMVVGLAVLVVSGQSLLGLVFGQEYSAAYWPLVVLSVGYFCAVATGSCGVTLIMHGFARSVVLVHAATTVVMVSSSLAVGPFGNPVLLAASCALSLAVSNAILTVACRRRVGIWTIGDFRLSTTRRISGQYASIMRAAPDASPPGSSSAPI